MAQDERDFLAAIQATPADDILRLVYADWLDERGDCRGEFLRLQIQLKSLDPDHLQRAGAENRLSILRRNIDPSWLEVTEPGRAQQDEDAGRWCICVTAWH
jgi:uncharacterized protein (TIGR02996 family)